MKRGRSTGRELFMYSTNLTQLALGKKKSVFFVVGGKKRLSKIKSKSDLDYRDFC